MNADASALPTVAGLPALALVALVCLGAPPLAASEVCDAELLATGGSGTSYRWRGDRCEGAHTLKVSSSSKLTLVSLTRSFEVDPARDEALEVRWPPVADAAAIRLRGRSLGDLSRGVYYRMDAEVPAADRVMRWPTDVLAALGLEKLDLGMLGWSRVTLPATGEETVYVPLAVLPTGASAAADGGTSYRATVVPSERLEEIHWALFALGEPRPIVERSPLGLGYYPARSPAVLDIPRPAAPGFYRLEIDAALYRDSQRVASQHVWIYSD